VCSLRSALPAVFIYTTSMALIGYIWFMLQLGNTLPDQYSSVNMLKVISGHGKNAENWKTSYQKA